MSLMQVWGLTDTGLVRKENQDAYAADQIAGHTVCVVCDGMGGAAHAVAHHADGVAGDLVGGIGVLVLLSDKTGVGQAPYLHQAHWEHSPFLSSSMAFLRSCPQEASISPPRLRRTVAVTP